MPALLGASYIGFLLTVYSLPMSDALNISRYYYGFCNAAIIAIMLGAFAVRGRRRTGPLSGRVVVPVILLVAATVAQIEESRGSIAVDFKDAANAIAAARVRPSILEDVGQKYRDLQATIPAGASMLTMLDGPMWFDFGRNRIDLIDLPGAASPGRDMPLDSDQKLVGYWRDLGYRYVAFVKSTASVSLYRRDHWQRMGAGESAEIWRLSAPYYLKMFDRFDSLAKTHRHLYDDGVMVALDLGAPAKP